MSDWSADVCSSDRIGGRRIEPGIARTLMLDIEEGECFEIATDFAGVIDRAGEGPARDEGRAAPAGAPHELEIVRQSAVGISDAAAKREPFGGAQDRSIGSAHVCTPVTNAHLVCRLLLDKTTEDHHLKKKQEI